MGRPAGSKAPPAKLKQGDDQVFGIRRPLLNTKLPLNKEVAGALAYEAEMERKRRNKKEIDCKDATEKVVEKVIGVYSRLNIPTTQRHKVKERVQDFWRMRREAIMAKGAGGKGRKKKNWKVKKRFCDIADSLFDVVDENNVPDEEKEFLGAQRKPGREDCIDGVDKKISTAMSEAKKKENKRVKNKEEEERKLQRLRSKSEKDVEKMNKEVEMEYSDSEEETDENDNEFKVRYDRKEKEQKRKRDREAKEKIGEVADRFFMSSDSVAHVANAVRVADNIEEIP